MVNFGFNFASLIGVVSFVLGLLYFPISIAQLIVSIRQSGSIMNIASRIALILVAPSCLMLYGVILIFQGWRYDPIMQFGTFLNELLLIYYVIKDIKSVNRNP